jgi:hypothetical protein
MLDIPNFFFQMMCHNLMKLWHIFQNDRSHEIVTHHLGTNFWKKILRCRAFSFFLYLFFFFYSVVPNVQDLQPNAIDQRFW